jgi:hypothetical protein
MRAEWAPEHAGSIRKSDFIMVRPLKGGNTPVVIESWYQLCAGHQHFGHTNAAVAVSKALRMSGGMVRQYEASCLFWTVFHRVRQEGRSDPGQPQKMNTH